MDANKKITAATICKYSFAAACATLPWIDLFSVTTYLLLFSALSLVLSKQMRQVKLVHFINPLSILFTLFYLLQWVGYFIKPSAGNAFALEQKAGLLVIPVFLSAFITAVPEGWRLGVKGFFIGTVVACGYCLLRAIINYSGINDVSYFFYHSYSAAISANAIYLSLYALICMCMLVFYTQRGIISINSILLSILLGFLYLNIILLSSRIAIISASLVLLYLLFSLIKNSSIKLLGFCIVIGVLSIIIVTNNPIKERYQQLNIGLPEKIFKGNDFTNYDFNGLDLRLLLLRMGGEVLTETNSWVCGLGARSYHEPLNTKMHSYNLFSGDERTKDTGYINMDLHNQYMENLIQFGVIGLLLLLSILLHVFYQAVKMKNTVLLLFILIFSVLFLTESLLEAQAGLLLFMIFIYGEWEQARQQMIK